MCNIAGYTGFRRAAPVLIDMMRREEGFVGGYYTGIATIDHGRVYAAKVVGDLNTLLTKTDAFNFPGTTGIIQSRTPSGGDRRWAYPFVSGDGKLAFVENGSYGVFEGRGDFIRAAMELDALGYQFDSRTQGQVASYDLLPDGTCVHYCDVYCHLAEHRMRGGMDVLSALRSAVNECPAECVTVSIHAEHENTLFVTRYNEPMCLKRAPGESYLASTPAAFPTLNGNDIRRLQANSVCEVTPEGIRREGVCCEQVTVAPLGQAMFEKALALARAELEKGAPVTMFDLLDLIRPAMEGEGLKQTTVLTYEVIGALLKTEKVKLKTLWKPGMEKGLFAPCFALYRV